MPNIQNITIAPFKEGLDRESENWLLPNEAFVTFENALVSRGVVIKRSGYRELATGGVGQYPVTQSRMVDSGGLDSFSGLPVMGIFNYIDQFGDVKLICLDKENANLYFTTTNRLEYVSHLDAAFTTYTGQDYNFWSGAN